MENNPCTRLNNATDLDLLKQYQIIKSRPHCTPDTDNEKTLIVQYVRHLGWNLAKLKLQFIDKATGKLRYEQDYIRIFKHDIYGRSMLGEVKARLLAAGTPPKGTPEFKAWKKRVLEYCESNEDKTVCAE